MTLTEFDPHTRMPVAVRHESEMGWGRQLIAEHGVAELEADVVADLVEYAPDRCPAAAGAIETVTTVDGDVTSVTAWARCTAAACVATGAALDTPEHRAVRRPRTGRRPGPARGAAPGPHRHGRRGVSTAAAAGRARTSSRGRPR